MNARRKHRSTANLPQPGLGDCAAPGVGGRGLGLFGRGGSGNRDHRGGHGGGAACLTLEGFLRRIGVPDSEFTNPDGPGRIHL